MHATPFYDLSIIIAANVCAWSLYMYWVSNEYDRFRCRDTRGRCQWPDCNSFIVHCNHVQPDDVCNITVLLVILVCMHVSIHEVMCYCNSNILSLLITKGYEPYIKRISGQNLFGASENHESWKGHRMMFGLVVKAKLGWRD